MIIKMRPLLKNSIFLFTLFLSVQLNAKIPKKISPPDFSRKGNSCVKCHETLGDKLKKPLTEWRTSVHAKVGNNCNICHGGNSESDDKTTAKNKKNGFIGSPKGKEVLTFCGRGGCHTTELLQFERGPHYRSVLKDGIPNCTTCHGVHAIQRASANIIKDKACSDCHSIEYAKDIIKSIGAIETGLRGIQGNIDFLVKNHADVEDIERRLDRTTRLFRQLLHVFSSVEIRSTKKIIELEITNLINESGSKVALTQRLNLLYILTVLFGISIIIAFLIYSIYMIYKRR